MKLAGLKECGVCCEIMEDDGTMMRTPNLWKLAEKYNLKFITINDLQNYIRIHVKHVEKMAEAKLPTKYGEFRIAGYVNDITKEHHVALIKGDIGDGENVLCRVHSECLTGDVFGSSRCDCGEQLESAIKQIEKEGRGIVLYMRQEGRGIGKRCGKRAVIFSLCLLPLILAFALYYSSYHHFGVTVLRQNFIGNNLTVESFVYGLVIGLRFATLCMWLEAIFRVVTSDKVVYLFGRVSPRLSLFLTILLRFIPRVGREARKINLAQKGIGRGSNQGNVFQRFINCLRIFSMLITWMISALALESDSMRSRGSLLRGRTAFSIYRFDNRDRAFVITLFTCITLTVMGVILGASKMWYNPRIIWRPLNGIGMTAAIGYLALCLLPLGLELWTEYRFNKARRIA